MTPALKTVLHQALIKAVLAYLNHCNCPQTSIDRIKNLKDDETLSLISHSSYNGVAWKIVVQDAEFNPQTSLSTPLDPMQHETFYLLILWREIEKLTTASREAMVGLACILEKDTNYWVSDKMRAEIRAAPLNADCTHIIRSMLCGYIKEYLA